MLTIIELFAGAGGLAIGFERAGFKTKGLFELDKHACATLRHNRPAWNTVEGDVSLVDFSPYRGVDVVAGGFPCQAFSHAGKRLGFEDIRGTLFFQLARAIKETSPKIVVGENVSGLLTHDGGNTFAVIKGVLEDLGYSVFHRVLHATDYDVPQKRKRLIIVAVKHGISENLFKFPNPTGNFPVVCDALKAGWLYPVDVPESPGMKYTEKKKKVLDLVPPGQYWRSLPLPVQKEYMGPTFNPLMGGSTGMARRLAWDMPSLTLTTSPVQKMTERCHPEETRPLTVREYARIQTFPDSWEFKGSIANQYKQIGNAVPPNLAYFIAKAILEIF